MAKTKKPAQQPSLPFPLAADALHQEGNWLWIPLRKEWRDVTNKPEEVVRQKFIRALVEHYGYALEQMDQERRTQHGHKSPRADIVVWQSVDDKTANRSPALVVECKTDTIEIQERDYYQGESYTRATGCEFFVATNIRHTAIFKLVPGLPGEFIAINEIPKVTDWGDAKRLKEIRESLHTFNRKEFQDLLFVCHSILRDVHKMDPGRAFDTISKILFIKMYVERSGLHGTFTTEYLDRRAASRPRLMICDLIFRVVFHTNSPILPRYLAAVLRTSDLRKQIEERRTGDAPMMQKITKTALMELSIPLPDLATQQLIVDELNNSNKLIEKKRTEAEVLRQSAWSAFESALFTAGEAAA